MGPVKYESAGRPMVPVEQIHFQRLPPSTDETEISVNDNDSDYRAEAAAA